MQPLAWWLDSLGLCELLNRFTPAQNYEWPFTDSAGEPRRLRLVADAPDRWVVLGAPSAEAEFDPARTVVHQPEPRMSSEENRARWRQWSAPSPTRFLAVRDQRRYPNAPDWWVGRSHPELAAGSPEKTRVIAACVSAKYFDPGHVKRIDFLRRLERADVDLDIYGDEANGFGRSVSSTPPHDKSAALLPYRYYFDAENNRAPNYFTEKILDCLLAETLCFCWGAPNLDSFVDPRAYIALELEDFEADVERIEGAVAAGEWEQRLPAIRAEKRRALAHLHVLPALARAIDPSRGRPTQIAPGGSPSPRTLPEWLGERRNGWFVEISDRCVDGGDGPTLRAERELRWGGLCLALDAEREASTRDARDCITARDDGSEPVTSLVRRNGIDPGAIDWLALELSSPAAWLEAGGRLDPAHVRANVISMPRAPGDELERAMALLAEHGYEASDDGRVALRRGRDDVYGLYHLYTTGPWREIAVEQLESWTRSGLLERTEAIHAVVVGPEHRAGIELLEAALGTKLVILRSGEDASAFERPILEHAIRFFETEQPLAKAAWYVHGKGVSPRHEGSANVSDWRRYLEHFVVGEWERCLAALEASDVSGVNWREQPWPHFSGNFWWARPRYLADLPKRIGPEYCDAEEWIGANQPAAASLHESGVDHYHQPYPANRYRD